MYELNTYVQLFIIFNKTWWSCIAHFSKTFSYKFVIMISLKRLYKTYPYNQSILILSSLLPPQRHSSAVIGHKNHVALLNFSSMFSSYLLTEFINVFLTIKAKLKILILLSANNKQRKRYHSVLNTAHFSMIAQQKQVNFIQSQN